MTEAELREQLAELQALLPKKQEPKPKPKPKDEK